MSAAVCCGVSRRWIGRGEGTAGVVTREYTSTSGGRRTEVSLKTDSSSPRSSRTLSSSDLTVHDIILLKRYKEKLKNLKLTKSVKVLRRLLGEFEIVEDGMEKSASHETLIGDLGAKIGEFHSQRFHIDNCVFAFLFFVLDEDV